MKTNDNYKTRTNGWGHRVKAKREARRNEREARKRIENARRR